MNGPFVSGTMDYIQHQCSWQFSKRCRSEYLIDEFDISAATALLFKCPARLPRQVGFTRVIVAGTRLVQTAGLNDCEMDMVEKIERKVALP